MLEMSFNKEIMHCLLCRKDMGLFEIPLFDTYKKHLTVEHKVQFYIKWIVDKTLEEQGTDDLMDKNNVKNNDETIEEDLVMDTEEVDEEEKKYECNECRKEYLGNEFAQHISICQGIKIFACKVENCTETFDMENTEALRLHIQRHQDEGDDNIKVDGGMDTENVAEEEKKYECNECEKEYFGNELAKHISLCQGIKIFACRVENCTDTFNIDNQTELKLHIQRHQNKEEKKYACHECGKEFPGNALAKHISACQGIKIFACRVENCTETFDIEKTEELELHIQRHQDEADASILKDKVIEDLTVKFIVSEESNKLDDSLDRFKPTKVLEESLSVNVPAVEQKRFELKNHEKLKHVQYTCEKCTQTFASRKHLKKHNMLDHAGLGPMKYSCNLCDKKFKTKSYVSVHKEAKHSGTTIGNLASDNILFENSNEHSDSFDGLNCTVSLEESENVPLIERKRIVCDQCLNRYISEDTLEKHVLICKGFKNRQCKRKGCNETFNNSYDLKMHKKIQHVQFSCEMCNKTSTTPKLLKKHMLEHSGLGPKKFSCDICDKMFKTESYVSVHKEAKHAVK